MTASGFLLPNVLRRWLAPAPDSAAAEALRQGRSPWAHAVHLLWSAWIFVTPLFSGGYDLRWALLTLLSYPVFLLFYAKVITATRREAPRYALAMIALCFALLPWYPAALSYFIFGCVMLRTSGPRPMKRYLAQLLLLNTALIALALWIGYPWQAVAWLPPMTLVIGII
ncbi:MAG: sensor histidine kinase, partial [Luteimonas sp.]